MYTTSTKFVAMIAAWSVTVVVGTAQANIVYQEDFQGAGADITDFVYTAPNGGLATPLPIGTTTGLAASRGVLEQAGGNAHWHHSITTPFPVATPATDVVRLTFDTFFDGTVVSGNAYGGDHYVGLSNGGCCNESGIFLGMTNGGWMLNLNGLDNGPAGPIENDQSSPTIGQPISAQVDITSTGGANNEGQIVVELFQQGTTTRLNIDSGNPAHTHDLTASEATALSTLENVAVQMATIGSGGGGLTEYDNIVLDVGPPFAVSNSTFSWNLPGQGDWNSVNSWNPVGIPNQNTDAIFGAAITAPSTVSTDLDVSVRSIRFISSHGYAIAGQGSINLADTSNPNAAIDVDQGTHQFQAVVNLHNPTLVAVASNSKLNFNNALNLGGNVLTKTGAGTLAINNILTAGGGTLNCSQGVCSGSGTIGGDVINDGGTISPGNSPGVMAGSHSVVPEPAGWALLVMGILVLVGVNIRASACAHRSIARG